MGVRLRGYEDRLENIIQELETQLNRDENILRYLTVRLDKHAIQYFEKRRKEKATKSKDEKTQTESVKP